LRCTKPLFTSQNRVETSWKKFAMFFFNMRILNLDFYGSTPQICWESNDCRSSFFFLLNFFPIECLKILRQRGAVADASARNKRSGFKSLQGILIFALLFFANSHCF
jgi:hypothetical protein